MEIEWTARHAYVLLGRYEGGRIHFVRADLANSKWGGCLAGKGK